MARRDRTREPSLIHHRDFRLLWGGESISEFGSQVTLLAMPIIAVSTLHASTLQVGLLTAAGTAAFLLVGLPAGALVDRMRRRPVMIVTDMLRAVSLGSVPVAAALGDLTMAQLYAVTLANGVCTVFFDVAYQSYLPALVGRTKLVEGNAKLSTTQSIAQVTGPGVAGGLVQALGGPYAVLADAASFVFSAGAVGAIRAAETHPAAGVERRRLHTETLEGLRFVVTNPRLRAIAGCTATANFFSGVLTAVEVVFLVRGLREPPGVVGALFAGAGIGGVVGALTASKLASWLGGGRTILLAIGLGQLGAFLLPLAARGPRLVLFAVGYVITSWGAVSYNVNQVSFRQALCPARLLGRMNATMRFIVWGVLPLGGIVGGVLGTSIGLRPTMWVAAGGGSLALLWLLFSPMRRERDMPIDHADELDAPFVEPPTSVEAPGVATPD